MKKPSKAGLKARLASVKASFRTRSFRVGGYSVFAVLIVAAIAVAANVLAGAVGNLIDRALLGYVTDMFETLFMRFAVFNVADICVVVGGIAFCVYYLFFHGKEEGHGADSVAG